MLPNRLRNKALRNAEILEFIDGSDIDPDAAGSAMSAIHTFPVKRVLGHMRQHRREIALGIRERVIKQALLQLLQGTESAKHACHAGAGQRIVDALRRRHGHAEGGEGGVEQVAAAKGFHHRDPNTVKRAKLVEGIPVRIDIMQRVDIALIRPEQFQILVRRLHVIRGIDCEQDNLNEAGLHDFSGNDRIVGAHAKMVYTPAALQLQGVVDHGPVEDRFKIRLAVDVMDHAHIQILGAKQMHHCLKGLFGHLCIAGAHILPVNPGRAEMPLNIDVRAARRNGAPEIFPHLGLRVVEIKIVDAAFQRGRDQADGVLTRHTDQAFAAHADLAGQNAGIAKFSIVHSCSSRF